MSSIWQNLRYKKGKEKVIFRKLSNLFWYNCFSYVTHIWKPVLKFPQLQEDNMGLIQFNIYLWVFMMSVFLKFSVHVSLHWLISLHIPSLSTVWLGAHFCSKVPWYTPSKEQFLCPLACNCGLLCVWEGKYSLHI